MTDFGKPYSHSNDATRSSTPYFGKCFIQRYLCYSCGSGPLHKMASSTSVIESPNYEGYHYFPTYTLNKGSKSSNFPHFISSADQHYIYFINANKGVLSGWLLSMEADIKTFILLVEAFVGQIG